MTHYQPVVIKIGGHEIASHEFLSELAQTVKHYPVPVVIVHGGGTEISDMQRLMGIVPEYVDGVRVTDELSLRVVEMVLCGVVNKRLVRYLLDAEVDAIGLSGVDRRLVQAVKMTHPDRDMLFTGTIDDVRGEVLRVLLEQGVTPVIAPLSAGVDAPVTYNVNADHVAGAVAVAVGASKVIFISNVEGVLVNGVCQPRLDLAGANGLIADGIITGGMIPKVRTALETLEAGVPQAVITNLAGLKTHGGTVFSLQTTGSPIS